MTKLQHFTIDDDLADIMAGINQDGGVIVERFLSEPLHQRLVAELSTHAEGFAPGSGRNGGGIKTTFAGAQTKRFTGLATLAPTFAEVIDHDLLHAWAEESFKNDYWMNTAQAMIVGPGSQNQALHRDASNWPISLVNGRDSDEVLVSALIALSNFTLENGATRVVPGSHLWEDYDRPAQDSEVVQAVMPAESALLYTGKIIHGAGANVSEGAWRFGVHISFTLGQLTPEEAHTVTVPWEVAQHFSERVQHMLGYRSHRTFLPDWPVLWTANYRDIREALQPPPAGSYESAGERRLKPIAAVPQS